MGRKVFREDLWGNVHRDRQAERELSGSTARIGGPLKALLMLALAVVIIYVLAGH
jgi:hypothetical protein